MQGRSERRAREGWELEKGTQGWSRVRVGRAPQGFQVKENSPTRAAHQGQVWSVSYGELGIGPREGDKEGLVFVPQGVDHVIHKPISALVRDVKVQGRNICPSARQPAPWCRGGLEHLHGSEAVFLELSHGSSVPAAFAWKRGGCATSDLSVIKGWVLWDKVVNIPSPVKSGWSFNLLELGPEDQTHGQGLMDVFCFYFPLPGRPL